MSERDDIQPDEVQARVVYAMFLPVVRLATTFHVPLGEMKKLVETAYFHELRRRGMEVKDAQEVMGVSKSKAALLSRQLKESFMAAEEEHELPRRIEYMVWAEPLTVAKLNQVMPDVERTALESAVEQLVAEERIKPMKRGTETVYGLQIRTARRVWDTWLARLDGLNHALKSVGDAVYQRFFGGDDAEDAFARTLTFHLRRTDKASLRSFYEEQLFPFIKGLNDAAEEDAEDTEVVSLSVFWALFGAAEHAEDDDEQAYDVRPDSGDGRGDGDGLFGRGPG